MGQTQNAVPAMRMEPEHGQAPAAPAAPVAVRLGAFFRLQVGVPGAPERDVAVGRGGATVPLRLPAVLRRCPQMPVGLMKPPERPRRGLP